MKRGVSAERERMAVLWSVLDAGGRFCRYAAGAALATLAVLTVTLVAARYLALSLPWVDELARIAFVWMVALGAASGLHRGSHFAMTFLAGIIPVGWRDPLERGVAALMAGVLLYLLAALGSSISAVLPSVMPATGLSRAWLHAPLVVLAIVGSCFMTARAAGSPRRRDDGASS